jgi:Histidine kinase-, DNA gyrase B-, and HSP90-like ATPase
MFRVENADFIANKLAAELLPYQEYREAFKNAEEAVHRRLTANGKKSGGRIELDVDWHLHAVGTGNPWYVSVSDNGDGMTRAQLEVYMTTLAVEGANQNQSLTGNQGMGLKISGPTRHKAGVLIRSLKDGERSMVQIGWDGFEYGLLELGDHGELVVTPDESSFPRFILEQGSGTVVTFCGNAAADDLVGDAFKPDNTFKPDGEFGNWLFKYLNTRFYRLGQDGIEVVVRVPSGNVDEWPESRDEADDRMRGKGKSFNLSHVRGTAMVWEAASKKLGDGRSGMVEIPGLAAAGIPEARVHWWILPIGRGSDVSSRTYSGGSLGVLFQNELHDWRTGNQANPFLARMGVLFGKNRFGFILEPIGANISSDFARAHVLVEGTPVLESPAWLAWADQFRDAMPDAIAETMADEQAQLQEDDPDRARRIRDRLKDVMQLLRPKRARRDPNGSSRAGGPPVTGAGDGPGMVVDIAVGPGKRVKSERTRGIGAALAQVDQDGDSATDVHSMLTITPKWVTEVEAESIAIVNGNGKGLKDRAAALAGEHGSTADVLLLNRDFRGFQSIVTAINDWGNPDGDAEVTTAIETFTQEWIEQKMVEAVVGLRQLENGVTWTATNFDDALSPVALTAAFMADRYHTLREVRRQVGPMRRTQAPAVS